MKIIYILLGANLGDREQQLQLALAEIEHTIGPIRKQSAIVETAAWGVEDQPSFLNQVIELETTLRPLEVLAHCQAIENKLGRVRHEKWTARLIDIDILYYADEHIVLPNLHIPHPYIQDRKFTLIPLVEIAAQYLHPVLQQTQAQLLAACNDPLEVKSYQKHV